MPMRSKFLQTGRDQAKKLRLPGDAIFSAALLAGAFELGLFAGFVLDCG